MFMIITQVNNNNNREKKHNPLFMFGKAINYAKPYSKARAIVLVIAYLHNLSDVKINVRVVDLNAVKRRTNERTSEKKN